MSRGNIRKKVAFTCLLEDTKRIEIKNICSLPVSVFRTAGLKQLKSLIISTNSFSWLKY